MRGAPAALALLAAAGLAQAPVDFVRDVLPILEARCFQCHKAPYEDARGRTRKPKADLRLDGKGWILKGSKDHVVLVPGDASRSLLYQLTALSPDDDDVMPNQGEPLARAQIATLRRWIDAGADFGDWAGAPGPGGGSPRKAAGVHRRLKILDRLGKGLRPVPARRLLEVAGDVAQIAPARPGSPLLRVEFLSSEDAIGDDEVAALRPVAGHVTELNLARTQVTDAALSTVGRMSRLTRLDLRDTATTDAGLLRLTGLGELRYLNLYGTKVSDAGLAAVAALDNLEAVYLAATQVTPSGVARLRRERPKTRVKHDPVLPPPERGDPRQRRCRRR